MDSSTQEYNINRLIANNSVLCGTIQKLEKCITEAHNRVAELENVVVDKDRQLDIVYHRMNELYNILRKKDEQIQNLTTQPPPPPPPPPPTQKPTTTTTFIPPPPKIEQPKKEDTPTAKIHPIVPIPVFKYTIGQPIPLPRPSTSPPPPPSPERLPEHKNMMICVTRVNTVIRAVTAQKTYIDSLKKRNEIDLSSVVVEIKCKHPHRLWEETMKRCHAKYLTRVKLLRKSLKFFTTRDAEQFAQDIKYMYSKI
ncbi:BRO-D [Betabaculovirus altermyunipunctae]|uniref:BRO-D n=1 Tax=Betabaculovirus altermyunipunctae TaxID=3051996 RepID=A0A1S5YE94_9BBAC|nr:BRO-D [Betabaculovirus altermyunipunctae]AQQ80334.1 BRO-D [Betabaculovirus altermyunipunctae]